MNFSGETLVFVSVSVIIFATIIGNTTATLMAGKAMKKQYEKYKNMLEMAAGENSQSFPWLSEQISDTLATFDEDTAKHLIVKKHPARKAAEDVRLIAKEKRELQRQNKLYKYQLSYYETLFPWLEDFKEIEPQKGWTCTHEIDGKEESEYESIREWLSPDEYQHLPRSERYQLVLDRYISKAKSKWEIGIDYERYVGYVYEMKGYKVQYRGALLGLEDMGRDLVAESRDKTIVIQCKRD